MSWRIVEFSKEGYYLHKERGFLVVSSGPTQVSEIPLDDLGAVLAIHPRTTVSQALLIELAERCIPYVACNNFYTPARERWGDLVTVERTGHWEIQWGDDYSFGLSVWIHSARKIEMRKQLGQLSSWLQTFIQESLAARLGGKCGDQGTGKDRWEGKPEDFQTFQQWWDHLHQGWGDVTPEEQMVTDDCLQRITGKAPKELLCRRAPV